MRSRFLLFSCFILFAALLLALPVNSALAQDGDNQPTAVGLVSFTAATHPNGVLLTWETATELNTAGFIFHRRTGNTGDFTYLENIGMIDALGSPALGQIYQVVDQTAVLGQTYTYRLIEIEINNRQVTLGDVTITVGATPTPTPSQTPTATATVNPTAAPGTGSTMTPTPTATATATSSAPDATPTTTSAGLPTAVPTNFVTVTPASGNRPGDTSTGVAQPTAVSSISNPPGSNAANPTSAVPPQPDAAERGAVALAQGPETAAATAAAAAAEARPDSYAGQLFPADIQPEQGESPQTISETAPTALTVIGSDQAYGLPPSAPANAAADTRQTDDRSTLFLWLGFIVALLIFITGVVGSIILYTRRAK